MAFDVITYDNSIAEMADASARNATGTSGRASGPGSRSTASPASAAPTTSRGWHARVTGVLRALPWAALALAVTACATRPPATAFDRPASHALAQSTPTALGTALAPLERAHPGKSGFRLLPTGTEALQMRIALARAATKTLDMQYYIADEDTTGKLLLAAALYAADHDVRVRMLIDDLNFKNIDDVMAALNTHPHIEVRVFNPFASAQYGVFRRTADLLTKVDAFTRRMHNKAMIADNQLAIVGGRNLGDEYFGASSSLQFRDLDVLAAGPVTASISTSFDAFWNSSIAYPLSVLNRQHFDAQRLDNVRDALRTHWRTDADPYNAKPLNATPLADQLTGAQLGLTWANVEFRSDTPAKIAAPSDDYVSPPLQRLNQLMQDAQQELQIVSPYFVPHDPGVQALGTLVQHGVQVKILTNSLAATDAVAVQAGYSPYRVPLLEAGVQLYEFKPNPTRPHPGLAGSRSRASLHAKAYVIDRRVLVIGSLNLDPRSAHLNTELALIIHSPDLAGEVAQLFDRATSPDVSYRVTLATPAELAERRSTGAPPSRLIWTAREDGTLRTWDLDPGAGLYRNMMTGLFLLLPVNGEL